MAYIGKIPGGTAISNRTLDSMTGDGSTNTLTLSETPNSVTDVALYCNGVMQRPGTEYTLAGNTITFTSTPANGVFICVLTGGSENVGSPAANSITTDKLVNGVVTDAKISGTVSSSKISGALPALDGSALTGLASAINTLSTNNPAIDTNPATGVGTIWANTTTGQIFVCTDATADANVWTNAGTGTANIEPFGFSNKAYLYGGNGPSSHIASIEKFIFASETAAASNGSLTRAIYSSTGGNSTTHGYNAGGYHGPNDSSGRSAVIDKHAFANEASTNGIGNLTQNRNAASEAHSTTHSYCAGGYTTGSRTELDKFAYSSDGNATTVGVLSVVATSHPGFESATHGYTGPSGTSSGKVDSWSFASDGNATNVSTISGLNTAGDSDGVSSETHGYYQHSTNIVKFSFASENDHVDTTRDMLTIAYGTAGELRTNGDAYWFGTAWTGPGNNHDTIEKFNVNSGGNATDVGDLTVDRNDSVSAAH
tara:strand:+ start:63 stop:1511 length:1449 start_codon:yes stop_codon:yes gene_type:complete